MSPTGVEIANLTNSASDFSHAWSPDGNRIAFASNRDGPVDLYVMNADGSGVVRVDTGVGMAWDPTWSPDGTRLAFTCVVDPVSSSWWTASDNVDICAINTDGSGFARLTSEPGYDAEPDWSPDGGRILFVTDRYGLRDRRDEPGWQRRHARESGGPRSITAVVSGRHAHRLRLLPPSN